MLKRVFLICLSMFLLAGSYYLGAAGASAQSPSFRLIGSNCAVVGETAYYLEITNPPLGWQPMPNAFRDLPPVPVSSLISYQSYTAITDSGEGWRHTASGWVSLGTLGSLPTKRVSWGEVKQDYR
jgi:hypothetical protein